MTQDTYNTPPIPALTIPLAHVHLIEASAGTGKTWTLAALVVRLLVEGKRPCEQIIATTFTRAAAAEMRGRIRDRMDETKQLIEKILLLPDVKKNLSTASVTAVFAELKQALVQDVTATEWIDDPLNEYLIHRLLEEEVTLLNAVAQPNQKQDASTSTATQTKLGLLWAKKHLEICLIQFDHLFVGTLDSLCQKLLREFSFDMLLSSDIHADGSPTRQGKQLTLTEGDDDTVTNLTHNAIRIWRAQQHKAYPQLMSLLAASGQLSDVHDFTNIVRKATSFIAEPLTPIAPVALDFIGIRRLIKSLRTSSDADLQEVLSTGNETYAPYINTRQYFHKHGEEWQGLKQKLLTHQEHVLSPSILSKNERKLFDSFADFRNQFKKESTAKSKENFNAKLRQTVAACAEMNTVQIMLRLRELFSMLQEQILQLLEHQNYFVSNYVRTHLPSTLENEGKTTFSLQMRSLNTALQSEQGEALAQQIRHRYPVALIDEFQDVNADQAGLIYHIYQHNLKQDALKKGCLLLVGDPKQSIYGFRGSDVHNYLRIKKTIPKKHHNTLDTNRRSQVDLIAALNGLFDSDPDMLEGIAYETVNAHGVEKHILDATGKPVTRLLRHLHITDDIPTQAADVTQSDDQTGSSETPKKQTEKPNLMAQLAEKITELLSTHSLREADGTVRPLVPDDIAVLYRARNHISGLEHQLHKRGVPTFTANARSVFAGKMAEDMAAILHAMLHPYHLGSVRRALACDAFGYTQSMLDELLAVPVDNITPSESNKDFGDIQFDFAEAGKTWQKYGFLSAWQQLSTPYGIWQRLAQHENGERYLVDVRQLIDMIQTYALQNSPSQPTQSGQTQAKSQTHSNEHSLLAWYLQQLNAQPTDEWALSRPLPSATGVQLMTIHKSKGLEFPIVFVLGTQKETKPSARLSDLFLTVEQDTLTLHADAGKDNAHITADSARSFAESLRVAYVAFTRPSQLLYIVSDTPLEDAVFKNTKARGKERLNNALGHWLAQGLALKEDICDLFYVDNMNTDQRYTYSSSHPEKAADTQGNDKLSTGNDTTATPPALPSTMAFYPWQATSFSALSRQLDTATELQAAHEPDYVMEALITESYDDALLDQAATTQPATAPSLPERVADEIAQPHAIRFTFPRGANAGSFLHKVFEKLNFTDQTHWSWLLKNIGQQFGMSQEFARYVMLTPDADVSDDSDTVVDDEFTKHLAVTQTWLQEVLDTPLSSGTTLAQLPLHKRLPEMGFNLGLSSGYLSASQLSELMQSAGFPLTLPPQKKLFRYLKGEIDLIYEHAGKYYVLDYKSNHLGDALTDYQQPALRDAMNHAGYWLQAAIYTVALHRYLKLRLPQYTPEAHLGGVEYAFIRGMHPQSYDVAWGETHHVSPAPATGVISWQPPVDFVLALDALLGSG